MKRILHIDTTSAGRIVVELKIDGKAVQLESDQKFGSQVLLNLINQILEDNSLSLKDLTNIEVNTGPGSYTGIKVGVAVANALAFALKIPVNSKQIETELVYT